MAEKETRTIGAESLELRAADDSPPTISGYGAVFDSPSLDLGGFREIIAPGAFARSLKARGTDVMSFFNHNPSQPLGSRKAGNLTVAEDDKGLRYEVTPPTTTYAADLVTAMRAKLVRGSSFTFLTRKDEWHSDDKGVQIRTLLDVDLIELGPVTNPAYPSANSQVRSMLEARGLTLDGERAEQPLDIMALLAGWQPKDEAELRSALATLTALLPSEEPPPAEESPPTLHRLALYRRRLQLAQLAK